jgi:hypothetical protein
LLVPLVFALVPGMDQARAGAARRMRLAMVGACALVGCTPTLEGEIRLGGSFEELAVVEAEGAAWAAALAIDGAEERHLELVALSDARRCAAAPVSRFFMNSGPDGALVLTTWTEADDGCGTLAFLDSSCNPLMTPIGCTPRPTRIAQDILGGAFRRHLVVESEDGPLRLVDPWAGVVVDLAASAQAWRWAAAASLWIHDGGELALLDLDDRKSDRRLGHEVSETLFMAGGQAVFRDREGLWLLTAPDAEPELVASDGCEVQASASGDALAYLSPCAERALVWHDLASESRVAIAGDVVAFRADTAPLFFVLGEGQDARLFAFAADTRVAVADRASLSSLRHVRHDDRDGHLLLAELGGDGAGVLLHFDGLGSTAVVDHVSSFQVRHGHIAALRDHAAGIGTLVLAPEGGGAAEVIASGVPRARFGFASQLEALGFIADFDGRAGRLEALGLEGGERHVIAERASEFAEVRSDATPGLAYIVPDGDEAGIWFATPE